MGMTHGPKWLDSARSFLAAADPIMGHIPKASATMDNEAKGSRGDRWGRCSSGVGAAASSRLLQPCRGHCNATCHSAGAKRVVSNRVACRPSLVAADAAPDPASGTRAGRLSNLICGDPPLHLCRTETSRHVATAAAWHDQLHVVHQSRVPVPRASPRGPLTN